MKNDLIQVCRLKRCSQSEADSKTQERSDGCRERRNAARSSLLTSIEWANPVASNVNVGIWYQHNPYQLYRIQGCIEGIFFLTRIRR